MTRLDTAPPIILGLLSFGHFGLFFEYRRNFAESYPLSNPILTDYFQRNLRENLKVTPCAT